MATGRPDDPRCGDCWFLDEAGRECHWGPPLVVPSGYAVWPRVDLSDWCGKFEPAEPAEEEAQP